MQTLEVFAADKDMNRLTGPFEYEQLLWDRAYHEAGCFSVTVPETAYSPDWAFLVAVGRPEVGRILRVAANDTQRARGGIDFVTVSGLFCEADLARRVVIPQRVEHYGSTRDVAKTVTEWAETLMGGRFDVYEAPTFEGKRSALVPEDEDLSEVAYEALLDDGGSYRVTFDWEAGTWAFGVWRGIDRSQTQDENEWMVFADTWGNLSGHEASVDTSGYANVAYIKFEYDEPNGWESDGSPQVVDDEVPYTTKAGYIVASIAAEGEDEIEAVIDLSGIKPDSDDAWPRGSVGDEGVPAGIQAEYEAFPDVLTAFGLGKLRSEHPIERALDAAVYEDDGYLTRWDVGDRVTFAVAKIGMDMDARITRVTEVHKPGSSSVTIEVGERVFRRRERQV